MYGHRLESLEGSKLNLSQIQFLLKESLLPTKINKQTKETNKENQKHRFAASFEYIVSSLESTILQGSEFRLIKSYPKVLSNE